jgi:alpha-1,3-rhamnosyltransferase
MNNSNSLATDRNASVSVVVPSYNHAAFVEKCLRSIFKQTLQPTELLVIDDGSGDESPAVIERTLKDSPASCEFIARSHKGLTKTLNEALEKTRGDYFAYLGSDDLWLPEFLAARVKALSRRDEAVLAYGHAYSIDEHDQIIDCTSDWAKYVDGNATAMLLSTLAPLSPTVVYRRNTLARHGWNETSRLEDYELYLRLSADGDFAFDPRVLSAWRQHGQNTSVNLVMMMEEKLAAQQQTAAVLGVTSQDLDRFHTLARFRSAQELMRQGQKSKATSLAFRNLRGLSSAREALRMSLGLIAPNPLLRWNRMRKQRQAMQQYGKIEV